MDIRHRSHPCGAPGRRSACAGLLGLAAGAAMPGSALLLAGCAAVPAGAPGAVAENRVPPFSDSPPDGRVPAGWKPYALRTDRGTTVYRTVRQDGRTVVSAEARSSATGLQCRVDVDPRAAPRLEWSWRVDSLIAGADVATDELDDSPSRLVLAFDTPDHHLNLRDRMFFEQVQLLTGKLLPNATLIYCWDPALPVGTVVMHPRTRRIRYLVVESGGGGLGRWRRYDRSWARDFETAYAGETSGRIQSVGLLTDSDDLKAEAWAWYGDISVSA